MLPSGAGPAATAPAACAAAASRASGQPGDVGVPPVPLAAVRMPWIMFIPQANPYSPAATGGRVTVVSAKAGRSAETPRSGKTTREVQSPDSCRLNLMRTGTPARTWIRLGL